MPRAIGAGGLVSLGGKCLLRISNGGKLCFGNSNPGETSMRLPVLTALFLAATLCGQSRATAEEGTSRTSPWCATYFNGGSTPLCSFATREQCLTTVSGVGGTCSQNYSAAVIAPPRGVRHTRHG
jgi:Protein of unknown function (DUF3551)